MSSRERNSRLRALERVPMLHGLSRSSLRPLAEAAVLVRAAAGEILLQRGEACRGLLVVLSGRLEVHAGDEEEAVLLTRGPGESLGELSLVRRSPCPATVRAARDAEVLTVPADAFERVMEGHPDLCCAVVQALADRVAGLAERLEMLVSKDVRSRMAAALLRHSEVAGAEEGVWFELSETQEELAREILTTRESAARALRQLREDGLIDQKGRRVRVPSHDRLEGLAGSDTDGLALWIDPGQIRSVRQ